MSINAAQSGLRRRGPAGAEGRKAADLKKADLTRQRILDAAARTFMQKGYAGTRLNDIAEAAGVQAGSIYYHFESKDQILEAVLDIGIQSVFDDVQARVQALGPEAPYRARIGAAIEAHLAQLLKHGDYTAADIRNYGQMPDDIRDRHLKVRAAYGAYWRELLQAGRDAGEIRADADLALVRMLLMGALNWSVEWYDPAKQPPEEIARQMWRMLFDGIGNGGASHGG